MTLDQSALLDPLGQMKLDDVTDRTQTARETFCKELIDGEAASLIGAEPEGRITRHG